MPSFRVNVKKEFRGPIFDASRSKAAAQRMLVQVNDAIATEGAQRVRARLGQVLQNSMGFYESHIQVDRRTVYRGVTDSGVVYGGWLEGVSSRNSTTRFKGYRTFRMVRQSMQDDAAAIAQPIIAQMIRDLNG